MAPSAVRPEPSREETGPSLGLALGLLVVAGALGVGLAPLSDNSFLTHLATGRLILDTGSVPSVDPYTFTALGEPWVVQSWLASWLYATVEALAGGTGLRLLGAVLVSALTAIAWRLTRPATAVLARLALAVVFLVAGAGFWTERPLMFGMIGLALVVLVGEGGLDPRWLVPVGWLWVNSHGSFPLGVVYLVVVAAGAWLDGTRPPRTELRALGWLSAGVLSGAVGPLGPRVLVFPVELLQRQDVLSHVVEWQAPTFQGLAQRAFLAQVVLAVVLVARRPRYRSALVVAVFTAAALVGSRNIPVASLSMLPAMAGALSGWGSLEASRRGFLARGVVAVAAALAAVMLVGRLRADDFDLGPYPVEALGHLQAEGIDLEVARMAAPEIVGNLLEATSGPAGIVFYDDRFDMFPDAVSEANLSLTKAQPSARGTLDRMEVGLVLWKQEAALASFLRAESGWRVVYQDPAWLLACRRGAPLSSTTTC